MTELKVSNAKVVDCFDLDTFILEQTGREWDTLERASDSGILVSNGSVEFVDASWQPENWTESAYPPDHEFYIDTWQGQQDAVNKWLETGEAHAYLRVESILSYLVREGKLEAGEYAIHLWW